LPAGLLMHHMGLSKQGMRLPPVTFSAAKGFGLLTLAGLVAGLAMRRRFNSHLEHLDAELRRAGPYQNARTDLPAEVAALAARLGARAQGAPDFTTFEQIGQMWQTPGGKPTTFTARQTIRVSAPGFLWRATMGPVIAADYFVEGTGGLEVMMLGAIPIALVSRCNPGESISGLDRVRRENHQGRDRGWRRARRSDLRTR
jgi:hypothetical protein